MLLVEAGWRRLALGCGLQFFARLSVVVDHALREIVDLPILRLVDRELARLDFEHVAIRGLVHEIGRTHVLRGGGSSSRHLRARWWRVAPWRGTVLPQSWGGPQRGCDEAGGHMLRKHHSLPFHIDLMADRREPLLSTCGSVPGRRVAGIRLNGALTPSPSGVRRCGRKS